MEVARAAARVAAARAAARAVVVRAVGKAVAAKAAERAAVATAAMGVVEKEAGPHVPVGRRKGAVVSTCMQGRQEGWGSGWSTHLSA
jgi:hypothetical protein